MIIWKDEQKEHSEFHCAFEGKLALFTDPITRLGGEKCTYLYPTRQALKGMLGRVYRKPTFDWVVDAVRIMNPIHTYSICQKTLTYFENKHGLVLYTYLTNVKYQVKAHIVWNRSFEKNKCEHYDESGKIVKTDYSEDRNFMKHYNCAQQGLKKGGRMSICFGTTECAANVTDCTFGDEQGAYDSQGTNNLDLMYLDKVYPDHEENNRFITHWWYPVIKNGIIEFPADYSSVLTKVIR